MTDRRAFLKALARGAAYTAPVVLSFSVPSSLAAQVSVHKPPMGAALQQAEPTSPWDQNPPPGRRSPGDIRPDSSQ